MASFNDVLHDSIREHHSIQQATPRDLRDIENSAILMVLQELRTWIWKHATTMAMPGPQDRFAESIWHGTHVYLSYGSVNWDIHWHRIGDASEQMAPVGQLEAQKAVACIQIDAIAWSVHELMITNNWPEPDIPFEFF